MSKKKNKDSWSPTEKWYVVREVKKFNWELGWLGFICSFALTMIISLGLGLYVNINMDLDPGIATDIMNHVFTGLLFVNLIIAYVVGWYDPKVEFEKDKIERRYIYDED